MKHLFVDAAYDRLKLMDKAAHLRFVIEIIRRREDARRYDDGMQVAEQRPQGELQHQGVPGGTCAGRDQHRFAVQQTLFQDIEERLEKPRV